MLYILEGLIFTILAADMSGIHGRWARELKLPLGSISEGIWVAVPLLFFLVSIPSLRKRLGRWQHAVQAIAFGCIMLPILVFSLQTSQIPLNDFPDTETFKAIRKRFDNQVLVVSDGKNTRAYVSNAIDRDEVAEAIFKLDPKVKPINTEQGGGGQPATRPESK